MADARWSMIERMVERGRRREGEVRKMQSETASLVIAEQETARGSCVWSRIGSSERASAQIRNFTFGERARQ
jgi:hypothetical protein